VQVAALLIPFTEKLPVPLLPNHVEAGAMNVVAAAAGALNRKQAPLELVNHVSNRAREDRLAKPHPRIQVDTEMPLDHISTEGAKLDEEVVLTCTVTLNSERESTDGQVSTTR
jgi:hypothetical protein